MIRYQIPFNADQKGLKLGAGLAIILASFAPLRGAEITVPELYTAAEAGSQMIAPFSPGGPQRLQEVISATNFSSVPQALLLSGMQLREDSLNGFGFTQFPHIQINLSTTVKNPDALSAIFAENVGLDETIGGTFIGFGGSFVQGISPQPWSATFTFTTPFFYNPQAGNLLLEIRNYGGEYIPPGIAPYDAANVAGDGLSSLLGSAVDSTTGTLSTAGYVINFNYTPVPEPSTCVLLGLAAAAGVIWFYRRKGKT